MSKSTLIARKRETDRQIQREVTDRRTETERGPSQRWWQGRERERKKRSNSTLVARTSLAKTTIDRIS